MSTRKDPAEPRRPRAGSSRSTVKHRKIRSLLTGPPGWGSLKQKTSGNVAHGSSLRRPRPDVIDISALLLDLEPVL
jgi:hypothetical protein